MQTFLVILAVLAALGFTAYSLYRLAKGDACASGCAGCRLDCLAKKQEAAGSVNSSGMADSADFNDTMDAGKGTGNGR